MSQETRKGGLGRGLAALIPSGPSNSTPRPGHTPGPGANPGLGALSGARPGVPKPSAVPGAPKSGAPTLDAPKLDAPKSPASAPAVPTPRDVQRTVDPQRYRTSPRLGDTAADVILGGSAGARDRRGEQSTAEQPTPEAAPTENVHAEPAGTDFGATYREIPIAEIVPNPQQPRQVFDQEALEELVHSISEFGLLQPIVVRRTADESGYELIMGERRWRAATRAGLAAIPAIIRETENTDMLRDALLENIHRVQLNPLEEAAAYQQLLDEFNVTQTELADWLGRSRPVVTNMIRLLALPVSVQRRVAAGVLSAGHARALLGLRGDEAAQDELAGRIVAEGLSVRDTEEAVTLLNRGEREPARAKREPAPQPEYLTRAADRLADVWDTTVSVKMGRNKGRMVIEFGDKDDFERIMSLIEGRG